MLQKRDLQLVRLAVRRRWLTAEEGEDCLFLKRKFGAKYTIEEVIRRRGYLEDDAIQELSEATDESLKRRVGPTLFKRRTPDRESTVGGTGQGAAPAAKPQPPAPAPAPAPAPRLPPAVRAPVPSRRPAPAAPATPAAPPAPIRTPTPTPPPPAPDPFGTLGAAEIGEDLEELPGDATVVDARLVDLVRRPREERDELGTIPEPIILDSPPQPGRIPDDRTIVGAPSELLRRLRESEVREADEDATAAMEAVVPPRALTERPPLSAPSRRIADAQTRPVSRSGSRALPPPPTNLRIPGASSSMQPPPVRARPPVVEQPPPPAPPPRAPSVVEPSALGWEEALAAEPPEDDELGPELGYFSIRRLIGRGSMGSVYLAEPKNGGEPVALKVLHKALARNPEFLERFRREATAAASLESPHVVPVLGMGTVADRHYLALRYVDGWTLRERLDAGDAPGTVEAVRIARDVALALDAAEQADLVHRDVKPENIMISREGTVYLTDFGLARPPGSSSLTTAQGVVVGTPNYMAPEQALGHDVDIRADLYALGATLFHVLSGKPPFAGRSSISIIAKHVQVPAPELTAVLPGAAPELSGLISRLLAKNPDDRFARAADVVTELEQVLELLEHREERAEAQPPKPAGLLRGVVARSFALSAAFVAAAVGAAALAKTSGWVAWGRSDLIVQTALLGAGGVIAALVLLGALGLVRRGELPLPGSTGWLVTAKDAAGVAGAGVVVTSALLGPPAVLNLGSAALAVAVLSSWIYGFLLRRQVANLRADRGVGHMLAVLADPRLRRWRRVHIPILTALAFFSATRFALLAYFKAAAG